MSDASTPDHNLLQQKLLRLWKAFDDTPVPGPWVGHTDAFVLPRLTEVAARVFHDSLGMESRADLHGIAFIEDERYAWVGVLHKGDGPANDADVDRLFDAANAEFSTALEDFDGVVPWLLSPAGVSAAARARLLEAGALFSSGEDVRRLFDAFEIE